jgi:hypothetical protein
MTLSYSSPQTEQRARWASVSVKVLLATNIVMAVYALRYLFFARGTVFTQSSSALFALTLAAVAFVGGVILAVGDIFIRRSWRSGLLGLVLSTTPFPVFLSIFEAIAWWKEFRFV